MWDTQKLVYSYQTMDKKSSRWHTQDTNLKVMEKRSNTLFKKASHSYWLADVGCTAYCLCERQQKTTTLISLIVRGMCLCVKESRVLPSFRSLREHNEKKHIIWKQEWGITEGKKVGTWNVCTLLQTGKLENVKQEMKRNRLEQLASKKWDGGLMEEKEVRFWTLLFRETKNGEKRGNIYVTVIEK